MRAIPIIPLSDKHTTKQNKKNKSQARDKDKFKKIFEKECEKLK